MPLSNTNPQSRAAPDAVLGDPDGRGVRLFRVVAADVGGRMSWVLYPINGPTILKVVTEPRVLDGWVPVQGPRLWPSERTRIALHDGTTWVCCGAGLSVEGMPHATDPRPCTPICPMVALLADEVRRRGWRSADVATAGVECVALRPVRFGHALYATDTQRAPTPDDKRRLNADTGSKLIANTPDWAYPRAWALAVADVVEHCNGRLAHMVLDMAQWWRERECEEVLRRYHAARLDGMLPELAEEHAASKDGLTGFMANLVRAYERGRPGPDGQCAKLARRT